MLGRTLTSAAIVLALMVAQPGVQAQAGGSVPAGAPARAAAFVPAVELPAGRNVAGAYGAAVSRPKEDTYYPSKGDPRVDALHYHLDLTWRAQAKVLDGIATVRFRAARPTAEVRLDLGDPLRVRRVRLDGAPVAYRHPGKDLVVSTGPLRKGSRHTLRVAYRGSPKPVRAPTTRSDLERVGWTTTRTGRVWTMQEPFGAFTWYPVNDQPSDKAFYNARIDVPKRWVGVFNGELVGTRTAAGRTITRWHLASPAASYLTTIAIGPYHRLRDIGAHRLSVDYWVPDPQARYVRWLRQTPRMLQWLEHRLGRFPFDRVGVVVVPSPSAMETQTLVTFGRGRLQSSWDARGVLVHELAHQWYGDTVTPRDWRDLWLNEGFAMYLQILWETKHGGPSLHEWIHNLRLNDQYFRAKYGPPGAYDRQQFGSGTVYYCAALMLHELRKELGRERFLRLLRAWPQQHRFSSESRASYVDWLVERTGREQLRAFVRTWLMSPRTPS